MGNAVSQKDGVCGQSIEGRRIIGLGFFSLFVTAVLIFELVGCGGPVDPAAGYWESTEKIGDHRNELQLSGEEGLAGSSIIYAYIKVEGYRLLMKYDFSVSGQELYVGKYRFKFDCRDTYSVDLAKSFKCGSSDDFEATCEIGFGSNSMTCTGDGGWSGYRFKWDRVQ
jgi:hypothetical protein